MKLFDAILSCMVMASLGFVFGAKYGTVEGRQAVEAVACEPTIVGLRKNGKEIPLTSAQRDSLANDLRVRVR